MKIKLLKLGQAAYSVEVPPGSNVGSALETAHLPTDGYSLSLNGLGASREAVLTEGDVVALIPKVVGGVAAAG